ncbi:uncharacterized protein LACBIDRAFT_333868 [Laccaria bicolor S238N-H82]|uniref:Predicted protein n=1 Tax=Laccaria bicolor (strain S238N-H82 / ATCC MYA-4686) TaxID=486041 RepID=B0DXC1_LACBS|nr:uncharacterized protein LACBIDRAFT_333868 [Laccaria bicolor S238N-H82]EDR00812.1 predicted protein [Laccaria bicolor S238N-H82]|eukprot:XP_001888604.1 predicted protein [Laccaria bicolor S238N-H82]
MVVVIRVQRSLGAGHQRRWWLVVAGGSYAVELHKGEDKAEEGAGWGDSESVKFKEKFLSSKLSKFGCSTCRVIGTHTDLWSQKYCDARGTIYPEIKIMVVWCQIHHSGHTPPRDHDVPHICDFPDSSTLHQGQRNPRRGVTINICIFRIKFLIQDQVKVCNGIGTINSSQSYGFSGQQLSDRLSPQFRLFRSYS